MLPDDNIDLAAKHEFTAFVLPDVILIPVGYTGQPHEIKEKNRSRNVAVNVGQAIVADWNADCKPLLAVLKQMQQHGV